MNGLEKHAVGRDRQVLARLNRLKAPKGLVAIFLAEHTTTIDFRRIGVIGAGVMGHGVAQTFAVAGYDVFLRDIAKPALDHGMDAVKTSLIRLLAREKLAAADAEAALSRVTPTTSLEDLHDCDLVVEAVVEKFEVNKAVFGNLDRICRPTAILASNTSSISLTKIAATSQSPGRVIGMH